MFSARPMPWRKMISVYFPWRRICVQYYEREDACAALLFRPAFPRGIGMQRMILQIFQVVERRCRAHTVRPAGVDHIPSAPEAVGCGLLDAPAAGGFPICSISENPDLPHRQVRIRLGRKPRPALLRMRPGGRTLYSSALLKPGKPSCTRFSCAHIPLKGS